MRNPGTFEAPEKRTEQAVETNEDPGSETNQQPNEATPSEDEAVFAGLTESQIKRLLERTSKIDEIEQNLRKAHGKIGELNSSLNEYRSKTSETQPASVRTVDEEDSTIKEFEEAFPEIGPAIDARARKIAEEIVARHLVQSAQEEQAQKAGTADLARNDQDQIFRAVNLAMMDANRPGWRETVQSDEFSLWISAQPDDLRQTYATTWESVKLAKIIDGFKTHQASIANRAEKSKQRIEAAHIPSGGGGRVTKQMSDLDAFSAGFESVRNPRFYT